MQNYMRFNYRLYPTIDQESKLVQYCDAARFVFNILLERNIEQYQTDGTFTFGFGFSNKVKELRLEFPWLQNVLVQCLHVSAQDLGRAFKNRFSKKFKKTAGFPKFKSKRNNRQSFQIPHYFKINNDRLWISRTIGWIKMINSRPLIGKAKSVTIIKDLDEWYVSILCQYEKSEPIIDPLNVIGIDLGIKEFAITSDGDIFNLPETLDKETRKLKKLQRRFSKKKLGSKNRNKARIKVARQYRRITRIKNNSINNFVATITKGYDVVSMEDLNIQGMKKNRRLSGAIQQLPWYFMKKRFGEKSGHFHLVEQWYPSSKTCSSCGYTKKDLTLGDRIYNCDSCGLNMDRDLNAAINIKNKYLTDATSGLACGDLVRLKICSEATFNEQGSVKQEGSTVRSHESVGTLI